MGEWSSCCSIVIVAAALIQLLLFASASVGNEVQQQARRDLQSKACLALGPGKGRCGSDSHCCEASAGAVCQSDSLVSLGLDLGLEGDDNPPPPPTYCCGKIGGTCRAHDHCCDNIITLPFARTTTAGSCGVYPDLQIKCCARFGTRCQKNEDCCPENPPRICRQSNSGDRYCGSP